MNDSLEALFATIRSRRMANAENSYVADLNRAGLNKILEKVGEEATEVILAAKEAESSGNVDELVRETADLWFHTMVLLGHMESSPAAVLEELERRFGTSGLDEKASRRK